jgi:DNA-binding response OmpR family regulator
MAGIDSLFDDYAIVDAQDDFREAIPLLSPEKPNPGLKPHVLVLEDDELQLELLVDHLNSLGVVTSSVGSIAAAREQLENNKFSLAIFDIHLPDGSGLDLCESIADDSRFSCMPTIVLSSVSQANMVRRSRAAGASFFISKPYDPNVLLAIIEKALGTTLQ